MQAIARYKLIDLLRRRSRTNGLHDPLDDDCDLLAAADGVLRGLAPTRLRLAGAAAGFAAGSLGALVYSLHCPELAAPFLAIWYLLGMLIPTAIGAWLGPRLLRW